MKGFWSALVLILEEMYVERIRFALVVASCPMSNTKTCMYSLRSIIDMNRSRVNAGITWLYVSDGVSVI